MIDLLEGTAHEEARGKAGSRRSSRKEPTMRKHRPDTSPLRLVPSLRQADRHALEAIAPHTDVVRIGSGRTVVESGRPAREFLVLVEGRAVETDGDGQANRLRPGAEIGAEALRDHGRHDHTVVAETDATFVVIEGRAFRSIDRARAS
jgi:CRP-like cAMP-binding protein